jgi:four helix bundle protein
MSNTSPNPTDIPEWVKSTTWNHVEDLEEYQLAKHLSDKLQLAHPYIAERPRWASWYDQITRSSSSVLLNFCEAIGKGKGWYANSLCIARGELYETLASLAIGPKEITEELKPVAKKLSELLADRLI